MVIVYLLSLGETPASEGFGAVGVAALCALLALALMYGVLEAMNAIYRKNHKNNDENSVETDGQEISEIITEESGSEEEKSE